MVNVIEGLPFCSIDTNVLLRFIIGDVPKHFELVNKILENPNLRKIYINDLAIVEMVWVMEKVYKIDRYTIVTGVENILSYPKFIVNRILFKDIAPLYLCNSKLSFADCYLAISAENHTTSLLTFDKDLAKNVESAVLVG